MHIYTGSDGRRHVVDEMVYPHAKNAYRKMERNGEHESAVGVALKAHIDKLEAKYRAEHPEEFGEG